MSLAPLDTPNDSAENEQRWRNSGRIQPSSNYISHGPQIESIDPSKLFDFDPDAIQVMDDLEFEHLPEAVNREILKNSREIIFEDEEFSRRVPTKLYEENSQTLRTSREIILEEEEENVSMRRPLERNIIDLNARNTSKIYKEEKLPLMKVEENHEDVRNILQEPGERSNMKCKKNYKMYLEKKLRMQNRRYHIVPANRVQKDPKTNFFFNEKQKSLRKLDRNLRGDIFVTNDEKFFKESVGNASDQLAVLSNRDQENLRTNLLSSEKQKSSTELDRYLINGPLATNERLEMHDPFLNRNQDSLDEEKFMEQPAGNNMKYIKMLEEGKQSLKESLTLNQLPNYDFPQRKNDHRIERRDKFRIESEKRRPAADSLAKIIIKHKLHPVDLLSLASPFSDLSPESGFCEGNLSNFSPECGRREPRLIPRNRFEDVDEVKGDSSSSENNLSQKIVLGDLGIPQTCVQVPTVEVSRYVCDNIQIADESRTFSHSNLSRKRFIDDDDISVKCVKSRIIEISSHISGNIEKVDEDRVSWENNLTYKHFFDEDDSTAKCVEFPLNCIGNNIYNIEHKVLSDDNLSSKHFADDNNDSKECTEYSNARLNRNDRRFVVSEDDVVKCANGSTAREKIVCVDNGVQDINEVMKERSFPSASGKLFNDFGDPQESNCRLMLAKTNNEL